MIADRLTTRACSVYEITIIIYLLCSSIGAQLGLEFFHECTHTRARPSMNVKHVNNNNVLNTILENPLRIVRTFEIRTPCRIVLGKHFNRYNDPSVQVDECKFTYFRRNASITRDESSERPGLFLVVFLRSSFYPCFDCVTDRARCASWENRLLALYIAPKYLLF